MHGNRQEFDMVENINGLLSENRDQVTWRIERSEEISLRNTLSKTIEKDKISMGLKDRNSIFGPVKILSLLVDFR